MATNNAQARLLSNSSKSISDGAVVFFSSQPNRQLMLSKFPTKEDAQLVYDELNEKRHPNIAKVNAVFKADTDSGHYLAYEFLGRRLNEMIERPKFITRDLFITEFYRQLLCVLFEVMQFITSNEINIEWDAKLENICVLEYDGEFVFKLVGFREGSGKNARALCRGLSENVLREINKQCGWDDIKTTPSEMTQLLSFLEGKTLDVLRRITSLPILWSLVERRIFILDIADCLKYSSSNYVVGQENIIEKNLTDWDKKLTSRLQALEQNCAQYEAKKALRKLGLQSTSSTQTTQQSKEPIHGLFFFWKTIAHFFDTRTTDLSDIDDLVYEFESVFPDLIFDLSELACKSNLNLLISRRDFLEKLCERKY